MSSQADLPRGTVTLLFSDIEGSTRLVIRLRDRYVDLLLQHHRLLRAAFEEHGGREIGTQGDAFVVAFSRAREAVAAAVAGQRALSEHEWPEGAEVKVRIGFIPGSRRWARRAIRGLACIGRRASAPPGTAARSCCQMRVVS